jgi:hypothetical protein
MVYKRPPTLQAGGTRSFLPSPRELLELSAHPIVTSNHGALCSSQDSLRIEMCDLDHPVLIGAKNTDKARTLHVNESIFIVLP